MALPFTAGQRLTATDLNSATQQSAWTVYSTSWTGASVNPVLNNGTLSMRYAKVGRLVDVRLSLSIGSTTTLGTGTWSFSLPFASAVSPYITGNAVAGLSTYYYGSPQVSGSSVVAFFNNGVLMTNASPGAWATGNTLDMTFVYESTS